MTAAAKPTPTTPLLRVQHAVATLRGHGVVRIEDGAEVVEMLAAEAALDPLGARMLAQLPHGATIAVTGRRLASLGVAADATGLFELPLPPGQDASATVAALTDPTLPPGAARQRMPPAAASARPAVAAAVELCKIAGLLPAAVLAPAVGAAAGTRAVPVTPAAVQAYRRLSAATLKPVSEARVPLADAEEARIVAFRPADGGPEQFAILIGEPEARPAPLARLHSECFTGDLLGSLRCDCGDQLRGAIRRMAHEGAGVLLYLAQEGRGIGIANKLRAYMLQDSGLDTVDANHHLGFANDERDFWAAAAMLRQLAIGRVRLLTNNPAKLAQLQQHGIEVVGRVPHIFEANRHNHGYLMTKAQRSGHLLEAEDIEPPKTGTGGPRLTVV